MEKLAFPIYCTAPSFGTSLSMKWSWLNDPIFIVLNSPWGVNITVKLLYGMRKIIIYQSDGFFLLFFGRLFITSSLSYSQFLLCKTNAIFY